MASRVSADSMKLQDYQTFSDEEIIDIILHQKKKELLEILYDRYSSKIYYKCLRITKDQETSKDLAHDILVKIFLNLSKFKGTSAFSLWVHSITYNHCMDYLKKRKRLKFEDYDTQTYEQVSIDEIELENKVLAELKLSQLEALLKELKEEEKIILFMRYQDGMSVKQIAGTLSMGESAVKMRLKRSRDRLAQLLKAMQDEGI